MRPGLNMLRILVLTCALLIPINALPEDVRLSESKCTGSCYAYAGLWLQCCLDIEQRLAQPVVPATLIDSVTNLDISASTHTPFAAGRIRPRASEMYGYSSKVYTALTFRPPRARAKLLWQSHYAAGIHDRIRFEYLGYQEIVK